MSDKLILSIVIVCGVSLVVGATDLYLPSMPNMATYFGVSQDMVQYSIAAYLTGTSLVPFLYGYLADHKGRRYTMLLGFSFYVLGSLVCVMAPELWVLILGRFMQGAGGAAVNVTGFAALKDLYTKEESAKVIAYNGMAISMTPALAPVLGGYIEVTFGWRMNFVVIFTLAALVLTFMYRYFKESMDMSVHKPNPNLFKTYWEILKNKDFMALALVYPFLFGAIFCWITVCPFYFIEVIGLSPDEFGIYAMFVVFGYPIGAFANSRLIPKIGLEKTLLCGVIIGLVASLIFINVHYLFPLSPKIIVATVAFYLVGIGLVFATSQAMSMSFFPHAAGATSAVMHMTRMGAAAVGSYIGGFIDDHSLLPLGIVISTSAILSFCLFVYTQFRASKSEA